MNIHDQILQAIICLEENRKFSAWEILNEILQELEKQKVEIKKEIHEN